MSDTRLVTRAEGAKHIGATERTFDRWVAKGLIKPVWLGTMKRFRLADIDSLISETAPPRSPNLRPMFGNSQPVDGQTIPASMLPTSRKAVA